VIPQDSQWKYSNLAVGLLGHVIEQVSGIPYEQYVYEEITVPLGLANTRFELDSRRAGLKATGYSHPAPGATDLREALYAPLRGIASAGQLHSNVEDLAKWVSFQFSSGRKTHPSKVLSASTLAEMHRAVYMSGDWTTGQAIGWRMNRRGGLVLHEHGGGIQGFSSSVVFSVGSQTGVIVLANIWPSLAPYAIAGDIAELVINELGPVENAIETTLIEVQQDQALPYLGRYWAEPGVYVEVEYDGAESGFRLGAPGQGEYSLHGPTALMIDPALADQHSFRLQGGRGAGELAEFSTGESGRTKSFRLGGFLYRCVD
jgi:CubicO group peptidase (beta-lactamase class C family)